MTEHEVRRWAFLEDSPAVTRVGWLPPAEDAPALADLREAHLRVLAAVAETSAGAGELVRQREADLEAVRAAEEDALLLGKAVELPPITVTETQIAEARAKAEAARDALQTFARRAVQEVAEREPEVMAALDEARQQAAAKREQAQTLLAEADRLEMTPKRMSFWLARATGRSALGHYEYALMDAPAPPEPFDMEAALAGGTFTEVEINA